jgi:hypothetical protein
MRNGNHSTMSMKITSLIIVSVVILSLLSLLSITRALSELGEPCKFTGECLDGYCINGTCTFPSQYEFVENQTFKFVGECNFTADCLEGYCAEGRCVLPLRSEYTVLSIGPKSGCAGIIENCLGFWCLFCDVTWVLLAVGAIVAAFIARKRRGRMLPFIMFFVPIALGIFILPVLGFVLSLIEIFILVLMFGKPLKL